ncbi:hypothetical protein VFPFJ_02705 [Purpureocillium lilacinum]|uniref:Uncharacterized protein n=1 Tax=Purpureocillium lilacinum TaxID=33203 RepID=A0A179HW21_PURLI|nr:hypothetical protein VFPFJ_02705 [Purpureocillium lilacinum]OAQ93543.1 hypothetical protein VFPFJ_02705 [Purpureocillium lilacinum]
MLLFLSPEPLGVVRYTWSPTFKRCGPSLHEGRSNRTWICLPLLPIKHISQSVRLTWLPGHHVSIMRVSNDGTCNERFEGTSSEAAKRRGVKYTAADESSAVATLPGNFI